MRRSPAFRPALLLTLLLGIVAAGCDNSVPGIPDPTETPEGWTLVWSDEFNGTALDPGKWDVQTGDGCPELCGWGNDELQWYQEENITLENGRLVVHIREGDSPERPYTSARLRTLNRGDWTYGRFEIRARLPRPQQGLWPAIWMLPTDNVYGTWAASGEIDIMEAIGSRPREVFGTLHYGGPFPRNTESGDSFQLAAGTHGDDFFVFALEWEEGEIRWYINNVLYQTQTEWFSENGPFPAPFDQDFHLLLNVAIGGYLPGPPDETTVLPQRMEVDYVRVYERAE
jgi:beta-glucanase (GH16 family)